MDPRVYQTDPLYIKNNVNQEDPNMTQYQKENDSPLMRKRLKNNAQNE